MVVAMRNILLSWGLEFDWFDSVRKLKASECYCPCSSSNNSGQGFKPGWHFEPPLH